jgi:hypothetical protein
LSRLLSGYWTIGPRKYINSAREKNPKNGFSMDILWIFIGLGKKAGFLLDIAQLEELCPDDSSNGFAKR